MSIATAPAAAPPVVAPPRWLTFLLAASCGLIAANLYYAQPLVGPISTALGMAPETAGLIVTLTQMGYCAALLFVVPLGDLYENRRQILALMTLATAALLAAAFAGSTVVFLTAALFIGLGSVAVQILVPYASHLAPEAMRGQIVGNVMGGLMTGIMLARPVSSAIAELISWHAVFLMSVTVMIVLGGVLARALPPRTPPARIAYRALLASMVRLALTTPVLQRRALYQAYLFGAFSLFWTTAPLLLASPAFGLSQGRIALFALAGAAGAIAAPIAGRLADRGYGRLATILGMVAAAVAFLITRLAPEGSTAALVLLVAAAIILDFGVTTCLIVGQRAIYALGAESRSRISGLFMATSFAGGAVGSAMGGWAFARGGWPLAAWVGLAMPIGALLYLMTERRATP